MRTRTQHGQVTTLVARLKPVVSKEAVNEMGRQVRFCKREWILTPYRLAMRILVSSSTINVKTLADLRLLQWFDWHARDPQR